ncbi:MAG: hypothetical protein LLF99_10810 [Desulfobacteraceae bacterium]|nr:hypothetical protein [Desulfobacteraceae bacterium]
MVFIEMHLISKEMADVTIRPGISVKGLQNDRGDCSYWQKDILLDPECGLRMMRERHGRARDPGHFHG